MENILTRTAEISFIEKGIVHVKFKPDTILDKPDILENPKASVKLTGGGHCAILEINNNAGITNEALKFAGSKANARYRIANALFIKAAAVQLLWSFFISFFAPTVQNKAFTVEKKAIEWLRGFLD